MFLVAGINLMQILDLVILDYSCVVMFGIYLYRAIEFNIGIDLIDKGDSWALVVLSAIIALNMLLPVKRFDNKFLNTRSTHFVFLKLSVRSFGLSQQMRCLVVIRDVLLMCVPAHYEHGVNIIFKYQVEEF